MSDELYVGWNPALDIPSAVRRAQTNLDAHFAMLSTIDSTPRARLLPSAVLLLERLGADYTEAGDDLVIDFPTLLVAIDDYEYFTGFDEIWLCSMMPTLAKPENFKLTSDRPLVTAPQGLAEWMRQTSCRVGLGDGDGLNYVTFDSTLAAALRHSDPVVDED